jgi:RNA polymerase sigma-70 factor (ECF subfamily)
MSIGRIHEHLLPSSARLCSAYRIGLAVHHSPEIQALSIYFNVNLHAFQVPAGRASDRPESMRGSEETIEKLLSGYGQEIHAVAYAITRDHHAAEDITAETIIAAWRRLNSLRDPDRLRPWLLRIASRHALQFLRRQRRHRETAIWRGTSVGDQFDSLAADRLDIADAMAALPPQMRAVISLRYVSNLSVDEIAEALGRSRNTVKTELRLGLRHLRSLLGVERRDGA